MVPMAVLPAGDAADITGMIFADQLHIRVVVAGRTSLHTGNAARWWQR